MRAQDKRYKVRYAKIGQEWSTKTLVLQHDGWSWKLYNLDGTATKIDLGEYFEKSRIEIRS